MTLGRAIALAADRIVKPVEEMHRAIAKPWFAALGRLGRPVAVAHERISSLVYGSIGLGATTVGVGLDAWVAADSSAAGAAQAFVNGLWGDELGRHERDLAIAMGIRDPSGSPVPAGAELAASFPTATGRLVVLVHGLTQTEQCWHGTDARPGLARFLEEDADLTPVSIRYNTGLPVSTNGTRLSSLVEDLHANWPVAVQSIALVGHSLGGLVVRSACAAAGLAGHRWIEDLTDVVTIGSPHRGAPLEKFSNVVAWGLRITPQTRPLARFLDTRSQGIKDLRFGAIEFAPHPEGSGPGPLGKIEHHLVGGVVTSDPNSPIGAVVGDLLVRPASSTRASRLEPTNTLVVGGTHHFDLLDEPAVVDRVMSWLERRDDSGRGTSSAPLRQPSADSTPTPTVAG